MASCVSLTTKMLASLVVSGCVTYHNDENGFCVLQIKARGHRELVTEIGHAAVIPAGEWTTASGEWINDRTHAPQYPTMASSGACRITCYCLLTRQTLSRTKALAAPCAEQLVKARLE
jgi:hypothetical protein